MNTPSTCSWLRGLGLRLLMVGWALAASAPEPRPEPAKGFASLRDVQLTVKVRRALAAEAGLADQSIGVRARDGVVELWGPVPTVALLRKAAETASRVVGVVSVRTNLHVGKPSEPVATLFLPAAEGKVQTESASPDRTDGSFGTLTGRGQPQPEPPVTLGRPEPLPPLPSGRAVAATPPAATAPGVADAVEQIRRQDVRFQPIRVERRDGVFVLHGGSARGEDVMDFARALSRVAGVERVIVQPGPSR